MLLLYPSQISKLGSILTHNYLSFLPLVIAKTFLVFHESISSLPHPHFLRHYLRQLSYHLIPGLLQLLSSSVSTSNPSCLSYQLHCHCLQQIMTSYCPIPPQQQAYTQTHIVTHPPNNLSSETNRIKSLFL